MYILNDKISETCYQVVRRKCNHGIKMVTVKWMLAIETFIISVSVFS